MCLLHSIAGAFTRPPEELESRIGAKGADLIKRAFEGIDSGRLVDYHTHAIGIGQGGTGAFVNARMFSWRYPFHRLRFKIYMSASGVNNIQQADAEIIQRLVRLIRHIDHHGRHCLLAFDRNSQH